MKNVILKQATIIDSESSFHNQKMDISIENGIITSIEKSAKNTQNFEEILLNNLHVSQGWFDSSVSFGEPGFEDRETIANGLYVAAKSGFTDVALQPNTYPILDNQSAISFVKNKANGFATNLHPIGALTKNSDGEDLAELFDMKNAGAIAFGDYNKSIENANIQKIALQYVQDFEGLVISFCQDKSLKGNGVVNEGVVSTQLGLKGIPAMAEEIDLIRNLSILEYTGGKMHIPTLSTAKSVQIIAAAKKKGLNVTCSVSVHHLTLNEKVLEGFDSRYKVAPPLQTESNRLALIKGITDGTIDMITSDHNPIDIEHKKLEFDLAKNGTIGLETAFGMLQNVLSTEIIVDKLVNGKTIFGLEKNSIKVGNKAILTMFNPNQTLTVTKENILSKSKNSAFLGQTLKGIVYGIYNNGKVEL
ncbi:dihydroorotase [uncultured Flavobacterium sp.]|uniref:dihydroorotase n=1 Tax=uncultured Flavobacterium sp. TaxID=165435 RepID=UPI0030CA1F69